MKIIKAFVMLMLVIIAAGGILFGLAVWGEDIRTVMSPDTSSLESKFKTALMGDGVMELTSQEINSAVSLALGDEGAGSIKGVYIDFNDDKMEVSTLVKKLGIDFFVKVIVMPHMSSDGHIILSVDRVHVGKLPIPKSIAVSIIKGMLPANFKVVDGDSFDIGNKILMFNIKDMSISGNILRVELLKDMPALVVDDKGKVTVEQNSSLPPKENDTKEDNSSKNKHTQEEDNNPASVQEENPTAATTEPQTDEQTQGQSDEQTQKKITALLITNEQLYNVLTDVKSRQAKDWVNWVISINSNMIKEPNGDFSGAISSGKGAYMQLPLEIRNQIKKAALKSLDTSSVMFLVSAYGI